jgi:hypothetical protein
MSSQKPWYESKKCREFPLFITKEDTEKLSREEIERLATWTQNTASYLVETCKEIPSDMGKVNCLHAIEYTIRNVCEECEHLPLKEKLLCNSVQDGIVECMNQAPPSAWSPRVMKFMALSQQILEILEKKEKDKK